MPPRAIAPPRRWMPSIVGRVDVDLEDRRRLRIGRTVENANGDNLGEINNVIINEKGDVVAVVIGVGGFLGIGEKNVGVPFDELDFKTAEAMKDRTDNATREDKAEQNRRTRWQLASTPSTRTSASY